MRDFNTKKIRVKKERLKPKKYLGQVFLRNRKYLSLIISAANIKAGDLVLEIGAGTGTLTKAILDKGAKVIALEKDPYLASLLQKKFSSFQNLNIVQADVRNFLQQQVNLSNYKVIGNIPYYLTTYLIRLLLELKIKPKIIVLTIQKEVALRITAKPPRMNLLAALVQLTGTAEIINFIPRGAFWPVPEVDSAIIKIIPTTVISSSLVNLLKAGFSQKRKYLLTNLSQKTNIPSVYWQEIFQKSGISLKARAQELTPDQWKKIHQEISSVDISFML